MSFPVKNIRALCKKRGTSLAALERSLGFGNGVIAGWETAKSYPTYDRVSAVAAAGIPILAGIPIVTAVPAALKHGDLAEQFGNPEQLVLCTFQHPQQPV